MHAGDKIAQALARVKRIAEKNQSHIVRSKQINRSDREVLVKTKWLVEILKGWYLLVTPTAKDGESSAWYASYWDFARLYLQDRFDDEYCLSAENSINLHIRETIIPTQIIVICEKGGGVCHLPFDTSIFSYIDSSSLPSERVEMQGLQVMPLGFALCKLTPTYFEKNPNEAKLGLGLLRTSEEVSSILLKFNFQKAAARIIGALEYLGRNALANNIKSDLSIFGWTIQPINPFQTAIKPFKTSKPSSPIAIRIESMWADFREDIISIFQKPKQKIARLDKIFERIEGLYKEDAYHSLSIEGYQVNAALIEKVHNNEWNPNHSTHDMEERNALAARGYFEAFNAVKSSIADMQETGKYGQVVESALQKWYQSLFAPSMRANILVPNDLIGYRKHQVYIRNSRHVPLAYEALVDAMEAFFDCLKSEEHPAVRAILGHYIFVYIHPYMDGNGRLGRFLMNSMLVTGGYPWTIIHVENRKTYLRSLEIAGVERDIKPFVRFIASEVEK